MGTGLGLGGLGGFGGFDEVFWIVAIVEVDEFVLIGLIWVDVGDEDEVNGQVKGDVCVGILSTGDKLGVTSPELKNGTCTDVDLDDFGVVLLDSEECPNRIRLVAGGRMLCSKLTHFKPLKR
ncbi:hypothetical protein P691DRAFT_782166 [Macrolepiota fuliginosa MF-IS2]|uniref:Uncharacterized protein n=1 Tax=Macrolepiota fuliginosa MF-IS2 TaxID=1400762 RepID=A0A9P5WZC9_9AGAR|nr:hypothetical protein P691DRAFT_782166 [Macrolepiota fuliginosa MF-IS2]